MKKMFAALLMAFAVGSAAAVPKLDTCSVTDTTATAVACFDMVGNDANGTNGAFTLLTQGLLGLNFNSLAGNSTNPQPWFLVDKSDSVAGTQTVTFLNSPSSSTGVLNFSDALFGFYAITLKAGNGYDAYLMNFEGQSSVAYDISKGLSHASLWTFTAENSGGGCALGNCPTPPIPEPGTMALMAAGLLGVAVLRRRQPRTI